MVTNTRPESTPSTIKTIPLDPGLCRNITIHGYCKWADKGCRFNHGESRIAQQATKLRPETPTFTPGSSGSTINTTLSQPPSSIVAAAPVFVPRGASSRKSCTESFTNDYQLDRALETQRQALHIVHRSKQMPCYRLHRSLLRNHKALCR